MTGKLGALPLFDRGHLNQGHIVEAALRISFRLGVRSKRILSRDGTMVSLTPKAFDTLVCLVRNQGRMVTKNERLRQVWFDTLVEEIDLAVKIANIREVVVCATFLLSPILFWRHNQSAYQAWVFSVGALVPLQRCGTLTEQE